MKSILLVEDNPDDVVLVKRLLSRAKEPFELEVAQTGREAIELLSKKGFDCLILDYRLPDTNALELFKEVRDTTDVPAVFLTGLKDDRLMAGAQSLGAVAFITKDELSDLSTIVFSLLKKPSFKENVVKKLSKDVDDVYGVILNSIGEGLFCLDVDEVIVFCNRRLAEILGYRDHSWLLGKKIEDLLSDPKVFCREYDLVRKGESRRYEIELLSSKKRSVPVLISHTPLFDREKKISGSIGVVCDLTQMKKQEKELERAQKRLVKAEKMAILSQIAAEAVHEIRNPLNVIKTGLYLMKRVTKDKEIEKRLLQMEKALQRASTYIDELLSLSRSPLLNRRRVNMTQLVRESLVELDLGLLADVEVISELDEEFLEVDVDPERMRQVITNLIKNATEAMGGKGRLLIRSATEGRWVKISFTDTGPGIRKADIKKVFDPFFTTKGKGTGLGLAIAKRIIDAHKGRIEVESKEGEGTTFTIKLPSAV
jgi:PAS domain S-box-containing protein